MSCELETIAKSLLATASNKIVEIERKELEEGLRFNIFRILDRFDDEEKGHSAFIAELLNPKGRHGQRNLFLKLFFECLKKELSTDKLNYRLDGEFNFKVDTEKNTGDGRIDILISDKALAIAIENKIYAKDQKKQLERYKIYLDRFKVAGVDNVLIYLTLNGDKPSDYSAGTLSNDDYHCVSYEFVSDWLVRCVESCEIPQIKSNILQYKQCIDTLTGKVGTTMSIELTKLILSNNNLNAAIKIAKVIDKAKIHVLDNFLDELYIKMIHYVEQLNNSNCNYSYKLKNKQFEVSNVAREYYGKSRKKPRYFGYAIEVHHKNQHIVNFEIRIASKLYFGLWANDGSPSLNRDLLDKYFSPETPIISTIENMDPNIGKIIFFPKKDLNFENFNQECVELSDPIKLNKYLDDLLENECSPNLKTFIDVYEKYSE